MDWLDIAAALAKRFEGCRLTAYPDPATGGAPWTIGYGATGSDVGPGTVWTQAQADEDLQDRLIILGNQIDVLVSVALTPNQKAALVDFAYNLGVGALKSSTLLHLLDQGSYAAAADQFPLWVRAAGKVMQGLVVRRSAERTLFLS